MSQTLCQFADIQLLTLVGGIVAKEGGGDVLFTHLRPPDLPTLGSGIGNPRTHPRPNHRKFQLTEHSRHLEKCFAYGVGLSVPAVQSDGTNNHQPQVLLSHKFDDFAQAQHTALLRCASCFAKSRASCSKSPCAAGRKPPTGGFYDAAICVVCFFGGTPGGRPLRSEGTKIKTHRRAAMAQSMPPPCGCRCARYETGMPVGKLLSNFLIFSLNILQYFLIVLF